MFIFRSVRYWLTLLFLVLTAAGSLAAWLYVVPPLRDRLVNQKRQDLLASAALVIHSLEPKYYSLTDGKLVIDDRFGGVTREIDDRLGARVVIVDVRRSRVLNDSRLGRPLTLKDYAMYGDAVRQRRARTGTDKLRNAQFAQVVSPFEIPVNETTRVLGAVLISAPLGDVNSAVSLVTRQILLSTLLAMAVTLVAGYMAAYLIGRRLKSIERSAEAVTAGDFEVSVPVRGRDEIGQLARTFNTMGGRLENAFSQVEEEKHNAETLLDTLSEGVVAVTAEGRVARANPAAVAFLGPDCQPGAGVDDAFPEDVASLWRELYEDTPGAAAAEDRPVVFEQGRSTLEAFAYRAGHGRDFDSIVVVRDVTQQANMERARRDFVANASHEFKTPLFSLSGFLELLDEENLDPAERQEFLKLMKEQVERLQGLSLSLLDLSQMDAGAVRMRLGPVDPSLVARSVADEFQARAAQKRLQLQVEEPGSPVRVIADEEKVGQILRALVDNATKFSDVGGRVVIALEGPGREAGMTRIVVRDDGPGIEPEELTRVFDRFYRGRRVRRSRTGTGLGLSIARDLATLMGGTLEAESRPGGGSRFTLSLPLAAAVVKPLSQDRTGAPATAGTGRAHADGRDESAAPISDGAGRGDANRARASRATRKTQARLRHRR